jgi:hypothetical protein
MIAGRIVRRRKTDKRRTMVNVDGWVTLAYGVDDTIAEDFQRALKVFAAVPMAFRISKFTLNKGQTAAILGSDGKLALTGGPTEFTHNLPIGAGRSREIQQGVSDPKGRFTQEVWAAIRDWTDIGGLHIFYVPDFDPPSGEGGITFRIEDEIDPIIFVNQGANQQLVQKTKGRRGVPEHEIGHAFGLPDLGRGNALMTGIISSDGSDAGTSLSRAELETIRSSRLLSVATMYDRT